MKRKATLVPTVWDMFWHYADAEGNGCWEWQGPRLHGTYGTMNYRVQGARKNLYAHRVSWELANKREIPAGLFVMHSCDNKGCVNPAHLSVGTPADNNREYHERLFVPREWCVNGHNLAEHGRPRPSGSRNCRACERGRSQEQRAVRHALGVRGMKYASAEVREAYRVALDAFVLQQAPGFLARALDGEQ